MSELYEKAAPRPWELRQHSFAPPPKPLDRVKLSVQKGPLGGFDRADGELALHAVNSIEAIEAERDRYKVALERTADNMAFVLNHFSVPAQWYDKFSRELAEDRTALSQDTGRG